MQKNKIDTVSATRWGAHGIATERIQHLRLRRLITCNLSTKEHSTLCYIDLVSSDYHQFPELNQNLGGYKFKDDRDGETVVSKWLIMRGNDRYQQGKLGLIAEGECGRNNLQAYCVSKIKGKAVPLQAWSGPEGSRKLRFPDYMTTAQDGGKIVIPTHRPPLPPGNTPGTHFC